MDVDRFHNELAMRLGYERILKDSITIDVSEDAMVTIKVSGYDDISFKASESMDAIDTQMSPKLREILNALHQVYIATIKSRF